MTSDPSPRLQSLRARAVRVPMRKPHHTASGAAAESPRVLTDAAFDNGVVGHRLAFTYTIGTGVARDDKAAARFAV